MREKVNLKRSIPVVKATTRLRSAIRNFVTLSTNSRSSRTGSRQFHSVDPHCWMDCAVSKRIADWSVQESCKKQELKQFDVEISHHWTSWQRWKKEHKCYNTPCKFYPSDRPKGSRGAEGWNAYTPVIFLNETRRCKYFHTNKRKSDNLR